MLLDSLHKTIQEQLLQLLLSLAQLCLLSPAAEDSEHARILYLKLESECHLGVHLRPVHSLQSLVTNTPARPIVLDHIGQVEFAVLGRTSPLLQLLLSILQQV